MNPTNPSLSASTDASRAPTHEEISRHAQQLWEKYGRPEGRDQEIWLEAERELQRPAASASVPALVPAPTSSVATAAPTSTVTPAATPPPARTPQRPSRATATPRMPGSGRNSRSGTR